mmetsp:Transcript_21018/g.60030  ORF Transcript_21018/g.60030 Transcript_21018/m.60030 type:complete len:231 (+) Transcript_21018:88-780(+)
MFLFRCAPVCDSCAVEDTGEPTQEPFLEHTSVFSSVLGQEAEAANEYYEEKQAALASPRKVEDAPSQPEPLQKVAEVPVPEPPDAQEEPEDEPRSSPKLQSQATSNNFGGEWTDVSMYEYIGAESEKAAGQGSKSNNPASSKGSLTSDAPTATSNGNTPRYALGEHVHNKLAALEGKLSVTRSTKSFDTDANSEASRNTPRYAVGEHAHTKLASLEARFSLAKPGQTGQA